jgi:hypothetical protein
MKNPEPRIKALEDEIKLLKAEMDLKWEVDLKRQQEIEELEAKRHKEVLERQDQSIFWQKIMGLGTILIALIALLDKIITFLKKAQAVVKEVKKMVKRDKKK